jgi:hypothetical protein
LDIISRSAWDSELSAFASQAPTTWPDDPINTDYTDTFDATLEYCLSVYREVAVKVSYTLKTHQTKSRDKTGPPKAIL